MNKKLSLEAQLSILLFILIIAIVSIFCVIQIVINQIWLSALLTITITLPACIIILNYYMHPINKILTALHDGFHNFLDHDFSISLAKTRNDELGDLVDVYNKVSETLRDERVYLYQRELLLDTVIQTTPLCLVLVDDSNAIIYSNNAARQLFHSGKAINGLNFKSLLQAQAKPFSQAVDSGLSGLFNVIEEDSYETYHLTQNNFLLNSKKHQLYLFKKLTKEISRQEVNTWKKVIRLISHELNNSLAPISSLAYSGQLLSNQPELNKINHIFITIEERAKYLQSFIEGYAKFSRLPQPIIKPIEAYPFLENLKKIKDFTIECQDKQKTVDCDPSQLQQVIINLIKNAHESGSNKHAIKLTIEFKDNLTEIKITDRGKGMSEKNLKNALLPFYSTKSQGTGLGLPLCKEIIEAHGGKIIISNRKNGGLSVILLIPNTLTNKSTI
ncbi:sensor histidine kinase [Aliikangiella sp. IMCC44359]|uniref:sensor histidine kinase n=1 Tax=Aliikangiella sp. IMCC44359 TaxID=3459125 RepID=UPI00403B2BF5